MNSTTLNTLIVKLKYRFNLDEDKAAEPEIIESIKKGIEFKGANLWTLIFAIFIASIGLNVNSTAVIIGAMLISPIMGPIMGIGLGVGIFDFELIKNALKNLLIAILIGLLTSTIYFFISPLHQAQSELIARTSPTIWDVLIAFFGGLAGIVASSRKKYNNVIPGVAIATALMPPLCTAGYGLATMQWSYFFGAFYLFLINTVFISISTFLMVRFLKFSRHTYVDESLNLKVKRWVGLIAFLTILPSIYLAYHFVRNEIFKQNANQLINKEILMNGFSILNKNINPEKNEISISILNYDKLDSIKQLIAVNKVKYGLLDTKITIDTDRALVKNELTVNDLKEGLVEEVFKKQDDLLKAKDDEIKNLKGLYNKQKTFEEKKKETISEFYALYGHPDELIIDKSVSYRGNQMDTLIIVYLKYVNKTLSSKETNTMENWLKTKFGVKAVKILK